MRALDRRLALASAALAVACARPEPAALAPVAAHVVTPVAPAPVPERREAPAPVPTPTPLPTPTPVPVKAEPAKAAAPTPPTPVKPEPTAKADLVADRALAEALGRGGPALQKALSAAEAHRFQIAFARVREGATPTLERRGLRADAEYFFPASSMKVPIALASVHRMAELRRGAHRGYTRDATLRIDPIRGGDPFVTTFAREAFRALVVSDNASANRMLGLVGHREAHETLWKLGAASARLRTGFATGGELDPAELSPRVVVTGPDGAADELPARKSDLALPPTEAKGLAIGRAAMIDGRRVEGPMSFADKNAMRLVELQDALVRIVRPDVVLDGSKAAKADADDLAYLKRALGTLPSVSGIAGYDRNVVADYQLVPFLRGLERVRPRAQLEIHSKVGQAYGFLIDNAYVVDKKTGRGFFLAAAVYANPDEVMNDDAYAYDSVAFPVLADVAEAVARWVFETP